MTPCASAWMRFVQRVAVEGYVAAAATKSDLERSELQKTKTGVFTGVVRKRVYV
jgi:hypothetical protein